MSSTGADAAAGHGVRGIPRLLAMTAAVLLAGGLALPAIASAEPEPGPDAQTSLANSPSLSLRVLGGDPTITLYGAEGMQTVSIPVQAGLLPTELNVTARLPVNALGGTIEVVQDDRVVSRVPLPADDGRFAIPLIGARVVDSAVTVQLHSFLTLPEGNCVFEADNPLRLGDAEVRYAGQEVAPVAVADFLPPILRKLTIFVPREPSSAESDAALKLATATVARYGTQRIEVELVENDGAAVPAPQPLERQIIVREGGEARLALTGTNAVRALSVSGSAGDLANQTRLLSSDLARLAVQSAAVVGPLSAAPVLPSDHTTIRGLGQPGVNATALVNPKVTIPLDQTRLGRAVQDVRVHLQGSYTPLPSGLAGQVVVSVRGEVLDRWPTESAGAIDRWVSVPNRLLERYTNLDVEVNAAGNTGRCGEFQPITLTIDGESAVESAPADPPTPLGFQSLPQALMPRIEIGIGDGSSVEFADLRRAVSILTGLQRLSGLPFDTAVVSTDAAIASANPAVVVSADGWDAANVTLPVAVSSDGVITVENVDGTGKSTTLALDPQVGFGSLQALYSGGRTLLVATSSDAPGELDRLLQWLDTDVMRWSGVRGNALIAVPGRDVIQLTTPESAQPDAAASADHGSRYLLAGAAATAVVVIGAALLLLRARRSRGAADPS
ncbi:hypothetical protein [Arthrobacter sp. SLBN-53]|uniref:hypothetical protein n=1 Tax=Arthrobacter sp. SLBN-53 TaxID=2768412 RepID=UPI001166BDBC|nr:hypothetical protein [Arthrobacter sp. SLBN-53]TQK30683.1 hypothetical protein FBY28_3711 [Arthrobacter sp. SLBN-53]